MSRPVSSLSRTAQRPRGIDARWRGLCVGTLLLAMLLVQALGLQHRIAHAGFTAAQAFSPSPEAVAGQGDGVHGDRGVHDCRLFDQASAADLLSGAAAVCAAAPQPAPSAARVRLLLRAAATFAYLARGPPAAG